MDEASVVFEDGGYGHACLLGQPRKADSVAERHGHVSVFCQVKIPKRRERQRLLGAAEQIVEISGVDRFPTDVLEKVFFGLGLWLDQGSQHLHVSPRQPDCSAGP
jgi:hypothetical protein